MTVDPFEREPVHPHVQQSRAGPAQHLRQVDVTRGLMSDAREEQHRDGEHRGSHGAQ